MYRHRSFGFGAILFPRNEPKCVKLLETGSFRTFYDSMQLSDYRISCVGTALKLYDQLGEEIYCEALRHIVEAWEGRPDSFRAAVQRGVMYFVQLYHGQYSAERLVRALSGVHPMELYRISRDNPARLPGWRRYVYPIYTTYNGKCRKDALPMKF